MLPTALHIHDASEGCELTVLAKPRSRRSEFAGTLDGALCVRLQAPPVDGKANEELISFLAKQLGVPKSAVQLRRGAASRRKLVYVKGLTAATVSNRINALELGD